MAAVPGTEACAAIVRRDDPHLWKTALFAPEPARSWLMVLYAFDIELSRATRASSESLIPRMRLQWWRDVIDEAVEGKPAKEHEVAGPLADMIRSVFGADDAVNLDSMVQARERELDAPLRGDDYVVWHKFRYGSLISAASRCLCTGGEAEDKWGPPLVSAALGADYAIRTARRSASENRPLIRGGLDGSSIRALARGELTQQSRGMFRQLATEGLEELSWARTEWEKNDPMLLPALLPLVRVERVLEIASAPDFELHLLDGIDRAFDGLRLAWRAARGRW